MFSIEDTRIANRLANIEAKMNSNAMCKAGLPTDRTDKTPFSIFQLNKNAWQIPSHPTPKIFKKKIKEIDFLLTNFLYIYY